MNAVLERNQLLREKAARERVPAAPIKSTRRIRVAHVLHRWSRSGMELQLAAQWACHDPRRVAGFVASHGEPERLTPELPAHTPIHSFAKQSNNFAGWLASRLREGAASVVHARGLWMLGPALRAARRAGDLPVVFSFHGFDDATRGMSIARRAIWRRQLRQCAAIATVSASAREELASAFGLQHEQIEVIRNGVDTRHFRPRADAAAARSRLGLHAHQPLLLCVGSLMPVKGYDLLLDALQQRSTSQPLRIVFVGEDHLRGQLQRRAARLLDVDARFVGNVDDVRDYYAAADMLVAPSRSEGLSNAILEAMACGLPVIATSVGGNRELVDDESGWLVPANDAAALSQAVMECVENLADAQARGATGALRARREFSLRAAATQYAELYERVVTPSRQTSSTDAPEMRWYAYGRAAWWHLLVALDAGPGDNVVLPDLVCDVMVEPLLLLGIEPRYYRSDPMEPVTANDLTSCVDGDTRAVLAAHYFGFPQPIDDAAAFCRQRGIPFIEDAAHGFLTQDAGRPLGAKADAILFSYRKTLPLPNGAGLLVHSRKLRERLASPVDWPTARRDVLRSWAKHIDRRWFGGWIECAADRLRHRTNHIGGGASELADCFVRPFAGLERQVAAVDHAVEGARRRDAFARMARDETIRTLGGKPLAEELEAGWVPYAFPVRSESQSPEQLCDELNAIGFQTEVWPRLPAGSSSELASRRWVLVGLNNNT